MPATSHNLIQRLQARNADRQSATDGGLHRRKAIPPLRARELRIAERALGCKLPDLLRAVYLNVANGGCGPAYGLVGTKGGAKLDGCTLETCYQKMLQLDRENSEWRWPPRLLPLANYGCGMWSCVDCEYRRLPMILWDPNGLEAELDGADAQLNWGSSFWDQGRSLKTWLQGWLANEPEPEPKWPSASWTRRRLGFTLPT